MTEFNQSCVGFYPSDEDDDICEHYNESNGRCKYFNTDCDEVEE